MGVEDFREVPMGCTPVLEGYLQHMEAEMPAIGHNGVAGSAKVAVKDGLVYGSMSIRAVGRA